MKRSFSQFDESIPAVVWELFPDHKAALDRIYEAEKSIERVWTNKKRLALATNCEPAVIPKILRVFVRSHFVPNADKSKSHFLVTIEGKVLDPKYGGNFHFGSFFDSIALVVDKRVGTQTQLTMLEWTEKAEPLGRRADCFRFKVYHDKNCNVKFYLSRSDALRPRYDIHPSLRDMLPLLRWDPSEEDILLALWSYIMDKGLVDSRSRSLIKADEALKQALGGIEILPVSSLRQKILDRCSPARAIVVEYALLTANLAPEPTAPMKDRIIKFAQSTVSSLGGRSFDLDVDIEDPCCYEILSEINRSVEEERAVETTFKEMLPKMQYLTRSIARHVLNGLQIEDDLAMDPLGVADKTSQLCDVYNTISSRDEPFLSNAPVSDHVQVAGPSGSDKTVVTIHVFKETGVNLTTAVHNNRGYIDVGSDVPYKDVGPSKIQTTCFGGRTNPALRQSSGNTRDANFAEDTESGEESWVRRAAKVYAGTTELKSSEGNVEMKVR